VAVGLNPAVREVEDRGHRLIVEVELPVQPSLVVVVALMALEALELLLLNIL
jgi:hypothetical protein